MDNICSFKSVLIRPKSDFGTWDQAHRLAEVEHCADLHSRLFDLPLICVIVDQQGEPLWEPTLFLAEVAIKSQSLTGDTVRTYAEALLPWLAFLNERNIHLSLVNEEIFGIYRAHISHTPKDCTGQQFASATINQRVLIPTIFHAWGSRRGVVDSPLGSYLVERSHENGRWRNSRFRSSSNSGSAVRLPYVIKRLPVSLSIEQIQHILQVTPMPYRLMLRWCLATGMRRLEVCKLKLSDLPTSEQIAQSPDQLLRIKILRKGSRELTVHIPAMLLEETNWFVLMNRSSAQYAYKQYVFLNACGTGISRASLTKIFRRSADIIGSDATLHHLRHTFAVHVLGILEKRNINGDVLNPIKTLQILLGHATIESTEIYLQAMQTSSDAVMEALGYLYGASL